METRDLFLEPDPQRRAIVLAALTGVAGLVVPTQVLWAATPSGLLVNDITGLNPIRVGAMVRPTTTEEVRAALGKWKGSVSIGGGRFSMGGQIAEEGSLHLDMRGMNRVIRFSPRDRIIRVQAGMSWRDLQEVIDPYDLSVKIMQSYSNFSVGGSISVNAHGRYVGAGPIINSVRALQLVSANGDVIEVSANSNEAWFYGAIGGYGAIGVVTEVELELVHNERIKRTVEYMPVKKYRAYFEQRVRGQPGVILHNADLLPPDFKDATAISWTRTNGRLTEQHRLVPRNQTYSLEEATFWALSQPSVSNRLRKDIVEPLLYRSSATVWRNHETSTDVASLGPLSDRVGTYALQEYFIPIAQFDLFVLQMASILNAHKVRVVNVSVRHSSKDPGTLLAWAREEVFSFVLYYYQEASVDAQNEVGRWTRKLIDIALILGGTYYLPYQLHATPSQFYAAYPRAREFFANKAKLDPGNRFRNKLLDKYSSRN
ncbi:FAD-binding oxidoreductase [Chitinimonas sp. PSY-7]|uniref:FAD-binding protein n=1 Tax=Chitinimonas sp. PSY-7 TaxID=3459088 RepID=UPI004040013D